MERKEFVKQAAYIIRRACDFAEKAGREGVLALGTEIDVKKRDCRDIFEYGIQFVVDDMGYEFIDEVLSNLIAHEKNEDARRLMIIQKDAVRRIQEGWNSRIFVEMMFSHIDDDEIKTIKEMGILTELDNEQGSIENPTEWLAYIVRRAYEFSKKARKEGLLALDDDIDVQKSARRDIFELGMRLTVDGTDSEIINELLSNLIAHEQDEEIKRLKTIQKVAVLSIQAGENTRILLPRMLSLIANTELETIRKSLSDTDIFTIEEYGEVEMNQTTGLTHAEVDEKFTEAIMKLDDRRLQEIIRQVDVMELAKALKCVKIEVWDKVFRNMSAKTAVMTKEDIEYMGPVRLKDIMKAQQKIISICPPFPFQALLADN